MTIVILRGCGGDLRPLSIIQGSYRVKEGRVITIG
jgi:hypothetical protein